MTAPFLEVVDIHKSYFLNGKRIDVLNGVTITLEKGELVSLIGAMLLATPATMLALWRPAALGAGLL